jgi:hypothetical protein
MRRFRMFAAPRRADVRGRERSFVPSSLIILAENAVAAGADRSMIPQERALTRPAGEPDAR